MFVNNPQSVDRSYKFNYKMLGIKFHRYLYGEGDKIEFIETEIPDTGQKKDMAVIVDDDKIYITEFMSVALYENKLCDLYDYHKHTCSDPQYEDFKVKTCVVSTCNPNHGVNTVDIDENVTFHVDIVFIRQKDGWKILNNLLYKTILREELSDEEAIDLLILPDMDIELEIKDLMTIICHLIVNANIPDKEFKDKIILCEMRVLNRFFKKEELKEMIKMLTKHPEVERVIKKYGEGFDTIYFDGRSDGIIKGRADEKVNIAKNFLKSGFDEEVVSQNTGIPIDELKKLKRKL